MSRFKFVGLCVVLVFVVVFLIFDFHYNRPLGDGEYPLSDIDISGIHMPMFSGISGPGFDFGIDRFFIWKQHVFNLVPKEVEVADGDQNTIRIATDQSGKRHYSFFLRAEDYNRLYDETDFVFSCLAAFAEERPIPKVQDPDLENLREKIILTESRGSAQLKLRLYKDPFSAVKCAASY